MFVGYFAQSVTYPLSVKSTVMTVNGSKLAAGKPPHVSIFDNWVDCLQTLYKTVSFPLFQLNSI